MRYLKLLSTGLFGLFCTAIALQSCAPEKDGIYHNNTISSGKHDTFNKLDDQLFEAAKSGDKSAIEAMLSKEMLDDPAYKRTFDMMNNQTKSGKYTMLDQYYIKTAHAGAQVILAPADSSYTLTTRSLTGETYVGLMLLERGGDQWLATAIFDHYDYGWHLNTLYFDHYSINGKNALGLLALAKQQQTKNYLVPAVNNAELAVKCIRPADIWKYKAENDISNYYGEVTTEAYKKFRYPIIIPVSSQPKIFRIETQTDPAGGYVPTIKYITNVDIRDTVALKKEFDGIKKAIGKALPGIDKDNKYIVFSAYNQRPANNLSPLSFDMVDKLK